MRILTHDQLHRVAPAIFASQPDQAVSERYGFVPTINGTRCGPSRPTCARPSVRAWPGT